MSTLPNPFSNPFSPLPASSPLSPSPQFPPSMPNPFTLTDMHKISSYAYGVSAADAELFTKPDLLKDLSLSTLRNTSSNDFQVAKPLESDFRKKPQPK